MTQLVCRYVCMYVCMYVCTYERTYVCMYMCMYVCRWVGKFVWILFDNCRCLLPVGFLQLQNVDMHWMTCWSRFIWQCFCLLTSVTRNVRQYSSTILRTRFSDLKFGSWVYVWVLSYVHCLRSKHTYCNTHTHKRMSIL